jgi:DNA-binding NarL/FixJ family response regulator
VIVDDDAGFRRVAAMLLRLRGYDVVAEASDAEMAFDLISALAPDAALIDFHLGNSDGMQLCRRLDALARPPRVLLTSSDLSTAAALDADVAFVPKERLATADLGAYLSSRPA